MAIITRQMKYDHITHKLDEFSNLVRSPGFEPGSQAWEACIITPRQRSHFQTSITSNCDLRLLIKWVLGEIGEKSAFQVDWIRAIVQPSPCIDELQMP
jgi:hypothetical protein